MRLHKKRIFRTLRAQAGVFRRGTIRRLAAKCAENGARTGGEWGTAMRKTAAKHAEIGSQVCGKRMETVGSLNAVRSQNAGRQQVAKTSKTRRFSGKEAIIGRRDGRCGLAM
ncbi:MAG: hypothetical protein IJV27_12975 [Prevotella sp.]|nr:hypothetical protein [Prevotella sp.]